MKTEAPTEDLTSDTDLGSGKGQSGSDLEKIFLGRVYKFKDAELWPYTEGSDILVRQLSHPEDNGLTRALKFLFVHIRRTEKTMKEDLRRHIIPLAWAPVEILHAALYDWTVENIKNDADKLAAIKLRDEILAAALASSIEAVPEVGKKKIRGAAPSETAFLISIFGDRFTREEILWEIPKAEMNQLVHAYLYGSGVVCREPGYVDQLDERIEEILTTNGHQFSPMADIPG